MKYEDYSYKNLTSFLNDDLQHTVINEATVRNLRNSTIRVFDEALDDQEKKDVRKIDIDDVLRRFNKISFPPVELSTNTISNYKSRINRAIKEFCNYIESNSTVEQPSLFGTNLASVAIEKMGRPHPRWRGYQADETNTLTVPIPLRDDLIASMTLPKDLTKEEAERIFEILKLYVKPS
ncbi:hypothetical protein ACSMDF_03510 [Yersinia enterocolitica]